MKEKIYRYSEIFGRTIQGEGHHSGIPTAWIRFFGCNFECQGFSQKNPRDPSTWIKEYENLDISNIKNMEEVPVLRYGCDSSYSWSKKFAHLAHRNTASEICDKLENILTNVHNPEGKFIHPETGQDIHMAFTGGEPMMQQSAIVDILEEFERRGNLPNYCTVETNGTQLIREDLLQLIVEKYSPQINREWFWSCSPKLSSSGESWEKAIKPDVLQSYAESFNRGQIKYVVDGSDQVWDEVSRATELFRKNGVNWPVWIMAVGSSGIQQEEIQAKICEECFDRGYNFSARIHSWIFNNAIGK